MRVSKVQGLSATMHNREQVSQMKKKPMREAMPGIAGWIDGLRDAFGADSVDGQIRKGMRGEPTFCAIENGQEVGRRSECGTLIGWHPVTGRSMVVDGQEQQG